MKEYKNETSDLELHVSICHERYQQLDYRLSKVESKMDDLKIKVESLHADLWKVLIGTMGTVIVSAINTFGVIYTHLK